MRIPCIIAPAQGAVCTLAYFLAALFLAMLAACSAGIEPEASAAPAREQRRCAHCGWIESKREMTPGAAQPHAVYEYTVRMADGSSRVFEEALPVSWRVRERLLFIDGARALDGAAPLRPGS